MKIKKILSIILSIVLLATTLGMNFVGTAAESEDFGVDLQNAGTLLTADSLTTGTGGEISALSLNVENVVGDIQAVIALPIDTAGDYAEFSFDMKVENGGTPKFMYRDNWANVKIEPVKVEGYRYTFNFQRTKVGDTGNIIRWFIDFSGMKSKAVISNMELYKTDENYTTRQTGNLLEGVYGTYGDFDGWSLSDNYAATWADLTAGKILYRGGSNPQPADYNRFAGSGVVTKPADYFVLQQYGLNFKVNGGSDRTHAALALPIADAGTYVEFSFDMRTENGQIPKFIYRDNYGNKSITPVKVEGYRYTFNFTRTKVGDTGSIVRWFFDFTNVTADVVISNMELYKTDANYENKEATNLLAGVYGINGDFDCWSLTDNYVSDWNNLVAGKVLFRSADTLYTTVGERYEGTAVVAKPLDYFVYVEGQSALNFKVNGGSDRTHAALALPIAVGDYVEFSFDMKIESGQAPKFIYRDNYANVSITPVKVEGYRYTFNFTRTKNGDTAANVIRWFFDFTNINSDVLISNMELYKTDANYENKEATNLLAGVYGTNGDFEDWYLSANYVSNWDNLVAGKVLFRSADTLYTAVGERYEGTAVVTKPLDYFDYDNSPKALEVSFKRIEGEKQENSVFFFLPTEHEKYYEFSFDVKCDPSVEVVAFRRYSMGLGNIKPACSNGYKFTFRFQSKLMDKFKTNNYSPFSIVFDASDVPTGITSKVYISNLEFYETDETYSNKISDQNLANKCFNGVSVPIIKDQMDRNITTTTAGVGDVWLRTQITTGVTTDVFDASFVNLNDTMFDAVDYDVNYDTLVNSMDLIAVRKHLLDVGELYLSLDVNNDKAIDIRDLVRIKKVLVENVIAN